MRGLGVFAGAIVLMACGVWQNHAYAADFISGDVHSGTDHPEAGVWVIAETDALPTPFRKIVVTNDAGRFVIPDLPAGDYRVWVRGYGLTDSARTQAAPGADLHLT